MDRAIWGRDRHPLEDPDAFSPAASLRSFNLLSQLVDQGQIDDLFEFGFAIDSTGDVTLVLDLEGAGILALEDGWLVQFCVDPDVDVPRLDRLATKLVWARGDWQAFRAEAVPLRRIDWDEMETRLALSGPNAAWLKLHYRSLHLLSRLMSRRQLEDLGSDRVALMRGSFIFLLGGEVIGMLDLRDDTWWQLEFGPANSAEPWSTQVLRHVIAINDPSGYVRSARKTRLTVTCTSGAQKL
jgi:hypothetical protein